MKPLLQPWLALCLVVLHLSVAAQCADCEVDPNCTSSDGFPALCPETLPSGTAGEPYETGVSVSIPAEITDPGTGLVATLNTVTITSVAGLPPGMDLTFDDEDGVYEPASGQTAGCATLCGTPPFPGVFNIELGILAIVTALGFEQEVTESFSLTLIIDPGAGGTSSFGFEPAAGCGAVWADFGATVFGEGNQITDHQWNFGAFGTASGAEPDTVLFDQAGTHDIALQTTILDQVLQQVQLFSTGGGGWDDFFGNPDPYFTLKDGNDNVVYTSGTVDDSGSATWTGLNVVLNNPPYAIDFYDEDLFDGDDWLGWAPFTPNGPGSISIDANPSNAQLTIGLNPVVTVEDVAQITVYPLPEVEIVLSGADGVACPNDSLVQYTWSLSGESVASGGEAGFDPVMSGWYSVMALDSNGCSAQSDSILFCLPDAGMPLTLTEANGIPMALEADVDHPWWVWYVNGELADTLFAGGHVWFPVESGWYRVESVSGLGCPLASDSLLVCWPVEAPDVFHAGDGELIIEGDFASVQWWLDGEALDGETGLVLSGAEEGSYTVWVTDFADCPGTVSDSLVYVGIGEVTSELAWRIHPNPVRAQFTLEFDAGWSGGEATVLDATGALVERKALSTSPMSWDASGWASGVHLIRFTNAAGQVKAVRRIVRH
ncbi:MAG: T9SS type A sorting domain-containing protein [Flavobacteriales bacterium]